MIGYFITVTGVACGWKYRHTVDGGDWLEDRHYPWFVFSSLRVER